MSKAYLHDDQDMSDAWAPWFSHEYIAYFAVQSIGALMSLPAVSVMAGLRDAHKHWPAGPKHIDIFKESYQTHRRLDPLQTFDARKRNGDFALSAPSGKRIEPWKVFVLYSAEPDLYLDEDLLLHKNQAMAGGSHGWRHMHFKLLGATYGMAPQSFRIHRNLAGLAFDRGNPYWGWRYLARAGHYLADLGNPFHVKVMPGSFLLRNIFARRDLQRRVSALHQSYEIYVERRFREGFEPFREALTAGAAKGRDSATSPDARLNGYIRRAEKRHKKIFNGLLREFDGDLMDIFLKEDQSGASDAPTRAGRLAAQAAALLFGKDRPSSLTFLDDVTCDSLKDVGWMQGALLKDFTPL